MTALYRIFNVNEETGRRWYLKDDSPDSAYSWTANALEATPLSREKVVKICGREEGVWGFERVR